MKPRPINIQSIDSVQLKSKARGEAFSIARSISDVFELEKIQIHHETLMPGNRASAAHRHSEKEELVYILSGHPDALVDGESYPMKPGDSIGFRPGMTKEQTIVNNSDSPVLFLTIGTNSLKDVVTYAGL